MVFNSACKGLIISIKDSVIISQLIALIAKTGIREEIE